MSIKRIIFLFIAVAVSFAVGIGFWTLHTDVVLSPAPESETDVNEGDAIENDVIVEGSNENIPDASLYVENLNSPESPADDKAAKDRELPIERK